MRTAVGPRAASTTVRRAFATRAAKKVEVVLSKDVQSLGTTGSIKKVSPGYFKNFLLPQGLAEPVTEQVMENAFKRNRRAFDDDRFMEEKRVEMERRRKEAVLKLEEREELYNMEKKI